MARVSRRREYRGFAGAEELTRAKKYSLFFHLFVAVGPDAYTEAQQRSGERTMGQFSTGEVVTCIPDMFLRHAAPGGYKVIAAMPDRDGDRMYRIKSPLEEYERVVKEDLLVRSEGYSEDYLPEEVLKKRSRRTSITLPKLTGDFTGASRS